MGELGCPKGVLPKAPKLAGAPKARELAGAPKGLKLAGVPKAGCCAPNAGVPAGSPKVGEGVLPKRQGPLSGVRAWPNAGAEELGCPNREAVDCELPKASGTGEAAAWLGTDPNALGAAAKAPWEEELGPNPKADTATWGAGEDPKGRGTFPNDLAA